MQQQPELIAAAQAAMALAYAPYSNFKVGAAVLSNIGKIHSGCNVENAAYPIGCCAEASAISAMIMAGEKHLIAVAVCAMGQTLPTPCGGCRQRIREFGNDQTTILICDQHGLRHTATLGELLPLSFGPDNLNTF